MQLSSTLFSVDYLVLEYHFAGTAHEANDVVDGIPVFVIGTPKFQDWVAISIKS